MEYSAGMVSKPFWYIETKKTAKYLLEGLDKNSIKFQGVEISSEGKKASKIDLLGKI